LKAWFQEAELADWTGPAEVKRIFPSVSILMDNRLVFNIKGNQFRLIVKVNYTYKMMWIRFVGSHAEYDKIDATTI